MGGESMKETIAISVLVQIEYDPERRAIAVARARDALTRDSRNGFLGFGGGFYIGRSRAVSARRTTRTIQRRPR
jgi:hypothetical protein